MLINYTIVDCALGKMLVAATERGLCSVTLGDDEATLESALLKEYPNATLRRDHSGLSHWVEQLLNFVNGRQPNLDLPLAVSYTPFQAKVWEELRAIPYGSTRSYGEIAQAIGQPTASRAVARACATNPVAMVIPCHRVIRENGDLGGYRWGLDRKRTLLSQEGSLPGAQSSFAELVAK